MAGGVFGAADIKIDRLPVLFFFGVDESGIVVWVGIAQIVPTAAGPLGHGVGFTFSGGATERTFNIDPIFNIDEGAFTGAARLVVLNIGESYG